MDAVGSALNWISGGYTRRRPRRGSKHKPYMERSIDLLLIDPPRLSSDTPPIESGIAGTPLRVSLDRRSGGVNPGSAAD